tara:strand:+ start:548 stop:808 length:261 start_codon:yes stop_codon:yes gene_type:complete
MNKTIEQTYFQLSEILYGRKVKIKVTFNNNGAHHGNIYQYDHDDLYDKTIYHYGTLACWEDYREYIRINNIPRVAMKTGLVKRIKL